MGPGKLCSLRHFALAALRQKSASNTNPFDSSAPPCGANDDITPAFWYSPTLFSKKFVLPCKEISSIQSKGLEAPYSFEWPNAAKRRSATNSMYLVISSLFMPIRSHESASHPC